MSLSPRLFLSMVIAGAICALFCLCLYFAVMHSAGPLEPVMGQWARQTQFVTYKGGSSANVTNGFNLGLFLGILAAGLLFFGGLGCAACKYQKDHPDDSY